MRSTLSNPDQFPVVVIGGGLAGLTAAVYLAEQGVEPLVLEADTNWVGGRLCGGETQTFRYQGRDWSFQLDHGMHALWGGYVNMRATIARFTDIQLVASQGEEWINRWGRYARAIEAGNAIRRSWLPAPFHYLQLLFIPRFWRNIIPLDFLSLPGFLFSIGWALGFDPLKEQGRLEGLAMKEFFRLWTPNLRATFTGLGVNLLAAPEESINVASFIAAIRFFTILRRDAWKMDYFPKSPAKSFLPQLVQKIEYFGGYVQMGSTAQKLTRTPDGWRITTEDRLGTRSIYAENVILALDPDAAQRLLLASPDTAAHASDLDFPPALRNAVVRIWFNKAPRQGTAGGMLTGDFAGDNFFWLHRLYDDAREWHEVTGGSVIEMHFYGSEDLMNQDDRHLLILAVNDVQLAFPELRGAFVQGAVRRNARTQTDFRIPDSRTLGVETPLENLFACGDWIRYDTPSFWMERSTVTGIAAANAVLSAKGLPTASIIAPPLPEMSVRVLEVIIRMLRFVFYPFAWTLKQFRNLSKNS